MDDTKIRRNLAEGDPAKQLITFAIPFLLANVLTTCYNLVDMVIVGKVLGSVGLTAVSNGGDIQNLFLMLGLGFISAGQIIISQYLGAGDEDGIRNTIGTLFTIVAVLSVFVTIIGISFTDLFLTAMQIPEEAFAQTKNYHIVCCFGIIFTYGYTAVSSILRGLGDSRHPLIFVAISTVLNLMMDTLFVVVFRWGARGAALATVIAQAVSFILAIIFLYRNRQDFGFDFSIRSFYPQKHVLRLICKTGIPLSIRFSAVNFSQLFVISNINAYGLAAAAITGVGNKIGGLASMVTNSVEMAGSTMIGQSFGAGKLERVKTVVQTILGIGLSFSLLLCLILLLWPKQVFGIWTTDADVLALVPTYLPVAMLNLIGFAMRAPFLGLINGLGFVTMSFVVGMLDGVVFRIGLAMLLGSGFNWGITGYWYGTVLAGYTAFFVIGPYYLSGIWKKRKPIIRS